MRNNYTADSTNVVRPILGIIGGFILFIVLAICSGHKPMPTDGDCCCPGYVKKTQVEYEYEQLIRPIYVEAVGFNGMVLVDSIGSVFVLSDDELLHEIIQYSYNVGDTIK